MVRRNEIPADMLHSFQKNQKHLPKHALNLCHPRPKIDWISMDGKTKLNPSVPNTIPHFHSCLELTDALLNISYLNIYGFDY